MYHYYSTDLETNMWICDSYNFITFIYVYEIIMLPEISETQPYLHEKQRRLLPTFLYMPSKCQGKSLISCQAQRYHGAGGKARRYCWTPSCFSGWGCQSFEHLGFTQITVTLVNVSCPILKDLFKILPVSSPDNWIFAQMSTSYRAWGSLKF